MAMRIVPCSPCDPSNVGPTGPTGGVGPTDPDCCRLGLLPLTVDPEDTTLAIDLDNPTDPASRYVAVAFTGAVADQNVRIVLPEPASSDESYLVTIENETADGSVLLLANDASTGDTFASTPHTRITMLVTPDGVYRVGRRTFDVLDYGAIPDGATDNSVAFDAAFAAAIAAGGGTVHVPAGDYVFTSNCAIVDLASTAVGLRVTGESGGSRILPRMISSGTLWNFGNCEGEVEIDHLTFGGDDDYDHVDCGRLLQGGVLFSFHIHDCVFGGLRCGWESLIFSNRSNVKIVDCQTGGNVATVNGDGIAAGLLWADSFTNVNVTRTTMLDYLTPFLNKTAVGGNTGWIILGSPNGDDITWQVGNQGSVVIEECNFDEGAIPNVQNIVDPLTAAIAKNVVIKDCNFNVSPSAGGKGIKLEHFQHLQIDRCRFGWTSTSGTRAAIEVTDGHDVCVRECYIHSNPGAGGILEINADDTVQSLYVRDSEVDQITSTAGTTLVEKRERVKHAYISELTETPTGWWRNYRGPTDQLPWPSSASMGVSGLGDRSFTNATGGQVPALGTFAGTLTAADGDGVDDRLYQTDGTKTLGDYLSANAWTVKGAFMVRTAPADPGAANMFQLPYILGDTVGFFAIAACTTGGGTVGKLYAGFYDATDGNWDGPGVAFSLGEPHAFVAYGSNSGVSLSIDGGPFVTVARANGIDDLTGGVQLFKGITAATLDGQIAELKTNNVIESVDERGRWFDYCEVKYDLELVP